MENDTLIELFLRSVGISRDLADHIDQVAFALQRPRLLWVGLILLIPAAYFIYRRQERNLTTVPRGLRFTLSATRVTILALLVFILAGPYLKLDEQIEKKPLVALLFDESRSMLLPAGSHQSDEDIAQVAETIGYSLTDGQVTAEIRKAVSQTTRAELARAAVKKAAEPLVDALADSFEVRYFAFSDSILPMAVDSPSDLPAPQEPGGRATGIGDAVFSVLEQAAGSRIAGIVLLSDGQQTGGRPAEEAAKAAAKVGAPIFTVPTGSSARLQDVSIVDIFTCGLVAAGDMATVSVTLESSGLDGQAVEVQLLDGEEVLTRKNLTLHGGEQQKLDLSYETSDPGLNHLKVHVPPLPEESAELHANNTDIAVVQVNEEKLQILFVDGRPRWDFRFLKNALRRDQGLGGRTGDTPEIVIETEARRRDPNAEPLLPATVEELAEYDLLILGDASSRLLSDAFLGMVAEVVRERGVGLVVAAGPAYMPHAFGPVLQDLLPVHVHPEAAGMLAPSHKPFQLQLSPQGVVHEVMRLYEDPGRNETVWALMPPYYWCSPAERPKPGATVLAWNPNLEIRYGRVPLIAYHFAGEGKAMFVGLDSTWHWRKNVGERFFYKFWGQAIRFMARGGGTGSASDAVGPQKSWLRARPVRVEPGQPVEIEAMAYGAHGEPRRKGFLPLTVHGLSAPENLTLFGDKAEPGRFTGEYTPVDEGIYRFSWGSQDAGDLVETYLQVLEAHEELRYPNINRTALQQVAALSGGEVIELAELAAIPDRIHGETKLTRLHREATVWDNWVVLLVLIMVYSLDVGLRRLKGLA